VPQSAAIKRCAISYFKKDRCAIVRSGLFISPQPIVYFIENANDNYFCFRSSLQQRKKVIKIEGST